jgi:ABC-type uncharacterized transport system fused permease/ATPase subunit
MAVRVVAFLALVFTALALIPGGAHLFSLPNKIDMTQEQYFVAQRAYDGWWMMAFILIPAMVINAIFAVMLRAERPAFYFALAGCLCLAATLVIFFIFTQPGNAATQNWTVAPANWEELRTRWEYSHAVNALLTFASFCLMAVAVLASRR